MVVMTLLISAITTTCLLLVIVTAPSVSAVSISVAAASGHQ
jgi:hypothetical protein